jgi:hypothetical protein
MGNACAGRLSERFGWHEASTTSGRLMFNAFDLFK